jgi:hypothetical protein
MLNTYGDFSRGAAGERQRSRFVYPEQQSCREVCAEDLVTELKRRFCFRTAGSRCTVERVVLNALAKNATLPPDICAFCD